MSVRAQSIVVRFVVVFAMTFGLMLPPAGASPSHGPIALAVAEVERHVEFTDDAGGHGHVHDDEVGDEQSPGHSHGHNPSDHSHTPAGVSAGAAHICPPSGTSWHMKLPAFAFGPLLSRLDRPPRPAFLA